MVGECRLGFVSASDAQIQGPKFGWIFVHDGKRQIQGSFTAFRMTTLETNDDTRTHRSG
jgi:hypothetical protein